MTRPTLGICAGVLLGASGAAMAGNSCDTIVYCDDLDTYVPGPLAEQECVLGTSCQDPGCPEGCRWDDGGALVVTDPSESEPNSLAIGGPADAVHTYECYEMPSVFQISADLYIPGEFTGETYFILLNTYGGAPNWSTQVHFSSDGDRVLSDFDAEEQNDVRFVRDAWKTFRVVVDLTADTQRIHYDDHLVIDKSWTDGVTGGGALDLEAMSLFANDSTPVYYDNFQICSVSPFGACCLADEEGTCLEEQDQSECEAMDGVFQGAATTCADGCPRLGPEGWELDAPFTWDDRQGRNDTCDSDARCEDIYEGLDIQFDVVIPWPSNWRFSTEESELLDTELLIGNSGICSADLVDDGGCVPGPSCSGAQDFNGLWAKFTLRLDDGDEVNVDVEEFFGDCGKIVLTVEAPCPDVTLPPGSDENETCGERENDGCSMDPGMETFTPISLGQTYRGKSWLTEDGTERDTDWYELTLTEEQVPNRYKITAYGEFGGTGVAGWIEYNEGQEGSGDCEDVSGFVEPFGTFDRCSDYPKETPLEVEVAITEPGVYWIVVAPGFGSVDFDCDEDPGADYWVRVDLAVACVPAPDGDVNHDGCTDFDDVLIVLSNWDSDGSGGGDADCDGDVDFDDLLLVLSGFDEDC